MFDLVLPLVFSFCMRGEGGEGICGEKGEKGKGERRDLDIINH